MQKKQNPSEFIKGKMTLNRNEHFYLFTSNPESVKVFPNSLEHAYLNIITDELDAAFKIFCNIDSPRGIWGCCMTEIIRDNFISKFPTFFQIRNFFEIDLDFLLKNQKISYVENLLGALDLFSNINQEAYKFAARVMYENRLYSASLKYMQQSQNIYYNDPELHFMLSKYYIKMNDFRRAYFYINECLKLLPSYYPAIMLKQQIEENRF